MCAIKVVDLHIPPCTQPEFRGIIVSLYLVNIHSFLPLPALISRSTSRPLPDRLPTFDLATPRLANPYAHSNLNAKTVRYYESGDIPPNSGTGRQSEQKAKFDHRAPVLACTFNEDGSRGYTGGLDNGVRECVLSRFPARSSVRSSSRLLFLLVFHSSTPKRTDQRILDGYGLDLNTERITHLGTHSDSISSMAWSKASSTSLLSLPIHCPFI
jgi:hypothetical protein